MHRGVQTLIHYTIISVLKTESPLFFEKCCHFVSVNCQSSSNCRSTIGCICVNELKTSHTSEPTSNGCVVALDSAVQK